VNINASPFHRNKTEERAALLARRAQQTGMPIVYSNLVGGQDELVFDGSSMAVTAQGECRVRATSFEEGLFPVTFELNDGGLQLLPGQPLEPSDSIEA